MIRFFRVKRITPCVRVAAVMEILSAARCRKSQDDVMDGLISIERAREVYGVIVKPDTFEVDLEGTKKLRAEKKANKK